MQQLINDGTYLWSVDVSNDRIYKLNPSNGKVISSFPSPGDHPLGLAWDGKYLWNADMNKDKIYKLDPTNGNVVSSFSSPTTNPTGLTFDCLYLWNGGGNMIYQIDIDYIPVESIISLTTDKANYTLGETVKLNIELNYTGPSVFASFKLELIEPSGSPDVIIQTKLFALKPGFYKNITLSYMIPVNMWISDGEYSFTGSLIDSFGNIIERDSVRFYINDSMPAKMIIP